MARRPEEKYEREGLDLRVDGEQVCGERYVYLMLHKPAGLLSATEDPRQPTVLDLLPEHLRRVGLFPVGRLDKDTEGLLLLTNDGPLGHRLLTPARHVDKVYFVRAAGRLDEEDAAAFRAGHDAGGWVALPAGGAGAAPGAGCRPCYPAGGEIPSGQADARGPGKAGALPEKALYGTAGVGPGIGDRRLETSDGGGAEEIEGIGIISMCTPSAFFTKKYVFPIEKGEKNQYNRKAGSERTAVLRD